MTPKASRKKNKNKANINKTKTAKQWEKNTKGVLENMNKINKCTARLRKKTERRHKLPTKRGIITTNCKYVKRTDDKGDEIDRICEKT